MAGKMNEEEIYKEAQRRVQQKNRFWGNLAAYVVVNTGIFIIYWFVAGRGYPWYLWVLGIWGVFLVLDFLNTFIWQPRMGRTAVEKEVERIRKEQDSSSQGRPV